VEQNNSGSNPTGFDVNDVPFAGGLTIGGRFGDSNYSNLYWCETRLYDAIPDDATRTTIRAEFTARWVTVAAPEADVTKPGGAALADGGTDALGHVEASQY
jgi:hypothetical protein